MRRRHKESGPLELLVVAMALGLLVFVAVQGSRHYLAGRASSGPAAVPDGRGEDDPDTIRPPSMIPPILIQKTGRPSPRRPAVPAPRATTE